MYRIIIEKTGKRVVSRPDKWGQMKSEDMDDGQFIKVYEQKFEEIQLEKFIVGLNGGTKE